MDGKKCVVMNYRNDSDAYIKGGKQKNGYEADEVENCLCPLCNSSKTEHIYTERKNLKVVRCADCGLIYVNPRVKQAEHNYWGDAKIYYNEAKLIFSGKKPHHRDPNYIYELKQIKKLKRSGKLIDIGCSMGFFLNKAKYFGFEVCGVEPSPSLSAIAQKEFGLEVINDYFTKGLLPQKSADVI